MASAAILMLEILAGRLMAPYVGVSLESFTGIIGTVLAGIAVGSAVGGRMADRRDPLPLIVAAYGFGGVLAWTSIPIVNGLGPGSTTDPPSIVVLAGAAFFAPAAVLSAVTPLAAKARLTSLEETGAVVGDLSASGTAGALVGTFLTGFVLVAALPTRWIIVLIGAALLFAGVVLAAMFHHARPPAAAAAFALLALTGAVLVDGRCDEETAYNCVRIEVDPDRASGRNVYVNYLRNSYVDLDDPTYLDFRYFRIAGAVIDALPPGPLSGAHIGGAGVTMPRYVTATRPGSTNVVLEIDGELIDIAERDLGLVLDDDLRVVVGDARTALVDLETDGYDLVIGDAFSGVVVPWHLTTTEVMAEIDRVLDDDGIYIMNVIDGGASRFARAELATLREHFDHVAVVHPDGGVPDGHIVNQALIASDAPLPDIRLDAVDGIILTGADVVEFIAGARVLTDDFAPVDQLTKNE